MVILNHKWMGIIAIIHALLPQIGYFQLIYLFNRKLYQITKTQYDSKNVSIDNEIRLEKN